VALISKVVKGLVCWQLVSFLKKHSLTLCLQSAYWQRHLTEMAVLQIISDIICKTADHGEIILLGLLDLSAAFVTADHESLLARLSLAYGIRSSALSSVNLL
jgi:hypothetical protein